MRNRFVYKPNSKSYVFGTIIGKKFKGIDIPFGEIKLRVGRHTGPNKGFGVEHIWAEHSKEMARAGFASKDEVAAYVVSIVREGASVHCDFSSMRGAQKLTVVRSKSGMAVLQYMEERNACFYSIVTAYSNTKPHGTMIGTVQK